RADPYRARLPRAAREAGHLHDRDPARGLGDPGSPAISGRPRRCFAERRARVARRSPDAEPGGVRPGRAPALHPGRHRGPAGHPVPFVGGVWRAPCEGCARAEARAAGRSAHRRLVGAGTHPRGGVSRKPVSGSGRSRISSGRQPNPPGHTPQTRPAGATIDRMSRMLARRAGAEVVALAMPVVIVADMVAFFVNPAYVALEQDRAQSDAWTGFTRDEVHIVTNSVLDQIYLGPPSFDQAVGGQPVFDLRERAHLADVRTVLLGLGLVTLIAAAILAVVGAASRGAGWYWRAVRQPVVQPGRRAMTLRPVGGVPVARIMGIEIRIQPVWILSLTVITAVAATEVGELSPNVPAQVRWGVGLVAALAFLGSVLVH